MFKTHASHRRKDECENTTAASASVESSKKSDRVEGILRKMSPQDMIGQLAQIDIQILFETDPDDPTKRRFNVTALRYYIGEMGIGAVYHSVDSIPYTASEYRQLIIQMQTMATNYSRPPILWGADSSIHGATMIIHGTTLTPQPLNMAATFNRTVAYMAGMLASRDLRSAGLNLVYSPTLKIPLVEPRWNRVYETFGEDPYVSGEMSSSMVRGIQLSGTEENITEATPLPSIAASYAKPFIDSSESYDGNPSWISVRHLYQYVAPQWKKVIDAGVMAIVTCMSSETAGVPMASNTNALNYLLRQQLGFTGVLVADWGLLDRSHSEHNATASTVDTVARSMQQTSIDVGILSNDTVGFTSSILQGMKTKVITQDRIRESTRRVLLLKDQLRMFDEVLTMENSNLDLVGTDEELALDMVRQSIIVTKNNNSLLPLHSPKERLKILVTGPTSNSLIDQTVGWSTIPTEASWLTYGSTVKDAVEREAAWNVTYTCGMNKQGQECEPQSQTRAVELAKTSDVVIVCVGEGSYSDDDMRSLRLPEGQYALVDALATQTNAKIVLVWFGGRPRLLGPMVDHADAVIVGFLPGPSAGDAVVDILSGRFNPSARLPISYPLFDDVPPYFRPMAKAADRCSVQWPLGHGLSFTTFSYSNMTTTGVLGEDLAVSVTVKNTGSVAGAETVLLYTSDESVGAIPEFKRLRAFDKVFLRPDEEVTIKQTIPAEDLRFVGPHDDHHYIIDPHSSFRICAGASLDCGDGSDLNHLCLDISTAHQETPYCAACEAACDIWLHQSSCGSVVGLSLNACLDMCNDVNSYPAGASDIVKDGWGWNYVYCLESVVTGMKRLDQQHDPNQCWKMTMLCRDIFSTENLDEYGVGPHAPVPGGHSQPPLSYALALLAGLISTLLFVHALHGRPGEQRNSIVNGDEPDDAPYRLLEDDEHLLPTNQQEQE